jgi:hypothetical protein
VIVLIYELLKSPRWPDWNVFLRWVRCYAVPPLIAGLLTVFYVYGKTHGGGSLASLDPYRPRYSWHNFTASNARFTGELLFAGHAITPGTLMVLWAAVFVYAFIRRDRTFQLMAFWIVIVPLPLAFIVPIRGDAPLYFLLFGWAMILAQVAFDLITLISKSWLLVGQRTGLAAATSAIGRNTSSKLFPQTFRIIATLLVASAFAIFTQRENQRLGRPWLYTGEKTSHVIQTFRSLNLRPTRDSSVLLLLKENIFQNKWNVFFIASLVWNDPSLRIWVENANELTPQQQENVDYIISVGEFQGEIIRSPEIPQSN